MIERDALPWLAIRAERTPDAPAVHLGATQVSYAELQARASRAAGHLRVAGARSGDRVAALLPNGLAFVELLHASMAMGVVLLPLNLRLTSRELAFQLRDSGARLLVHDGGEWVGRAAEAVRGAVDVALLEVDARAGFSGLGPAPPVPVTPARSEEPLAILYTSGTTGQPKGAVLSLGNFHASAVGSAALLGAEPTDRWLACLPLFHVGGLSILTRSVLLGSSVVVHERFDPGAVNRSIDEDGIVLVSLVSAMLARVLADRGDRRAPGTLRCVLLGGGPAPAPLLRRAAALGWPVAPTYGLTEATSQVATRPPGDRRPPPDGGLRPLGGTEIRVVDEAGCTLPAGEAGEIQVRGATVMTGYLERPEATARSLVDGWLHTGDVGLLDANGGLRVLDRRSDLIVTGGENVYPAEVEQVLLEHPLVVEAAVVGEADAEFGERPVAWVVAAPSSRPDETDLAAFCRERLAGYKVPVAFRPIDALPRNAAGKLLRRALRGGPSQTAD